MRLPRAALLVCAITISAYAAVPPQTPTPAVLDTLPPAPTVILPTPQGPAYPLTADRVRHLPLSTAAIESWLRANAQSAGTSSVDQPWNGTDLSSFVPAVPREHKLAARRSFGFVPTIDTTAFSSQAQYAAPPARETEPVVISDTNGASTYSVTAFMRFPDCCPTTDHPRIYAQPSGGTATKLPIAAAYETTHDTADPAIAENPYDAFGMMPGPHRVYIVGTDYKADYSESQVDLWYTDNGAQTFNATPTVIATGGLINNHKIFLDKPSVDVSWYAGTRGYVYAAVVWEDTSADPNSVPHKLLIFRSTNGGLTFTPTASLDATVGSNPRLSETTPQCPQIIVDHSTGNVYLIWLDWSTNTIYAAKSDAGAATWTLLPSLQAGALLGPLGNTLAGTTFNITAQSMIVARYTVQANKIGVVWHYWETDNPTSGHTDIRIATLDLSAVPISWINTRTVNHNSTGSDQWNPAIDYDNSGNALVAWYDRRNLTTYFRMYGTKVSSIGGQIDATDTTLTSPASDPTLLYSGYPVTQGGTRYYSVGDYQAVWFWKTFWRVGHIFAPQGTNVGVYFTDVNP